MNQEQINVPTDGTTNIQQVTEQSLCVKSQEMINYYLRHLELMCPTIAADKPDRVRLIILKKRMDRLIEMLTLFEHSWAEEVPVLQKACLSYLVMDSVPRKERNKVIEAWTDWSDFHYRLGCYRGLLTQFLQYHRRVVNELENLFNMSDTVASQGVQDENQ